MHSLWKLRNRATSAFYEPYYAFTGYTTKYQMILKLIPSERRESVLSYCLIFFPKLHNINLEITVFKRAVFKTQLSQNLFFFGDRARAGEGSWKLWQNEPMILPLLDKAWLARLDSLHLHPRLLLQIWNYLLVKVFHGHRGEIPELLKELMCTWRILGGLDKVEHPEGLIYYLGQYQENNNQALPSQLHRQQTMMYS